MVEIVKLQCPACAGRLDVSKDLEQFACGYCGTEVIVRRSGGTISLAPVVEGLKRVERGVDRTASELAIKRLEAELATLQPRLVAALASKRTAKGIFLAGCGIAIIGVLMLFQKGLEGVIVGIIGGAIAYGGKVAGEGARSFVHKSQAAVDQCESELQHHRTTVRL